MICYLDVNYFSISVYILGGFYVNDFYYYMRSLNSLNFFIN